MVFFSQPGELNNMAMKKMTLFNLQDLCIKMHKICAIWRTYAESGEALATEGLKNLKSILMKMTN